MPAIDLIDVCLPPHLHFPVSLQALAAGKHVICEKPLVRSPCGSRRIGSPPRPRPVGRCFRSSSIALARAMAQLARADGSRAGRPGLCRKPRDALEPRQGYYDVPWRGTWAGEYGGALLGHAIHDHDLLCHILGPVKRLQRDGRNPGEPDRDRRLRRQSVPRWKAARSRPVRSRLARPTTRRGCGSASKGFTAESGTAPIPRRNDVWTFTARAPIDQDPDRRGPCRRCGEGRVGFAGFLEAVADALEGATGARSNLGRRTPQSIELVTRNLRIRPRSARSRLCHSGRTSYQFILQAARRRQVKTIKKGGD